jgi:tetratricopeptide (TPR) repeat protein
MPDATPNQMKIFVSHNHADVAYCKALVNALRGAGADAWYDEENMGAGPLGPVIERELRARPVFLVVLSPAALGSQWVEDESRWAFTLYRKDPTRILLPVLCDAVKDEANWLFLSDFRRIETPGNQPYPQAEAIRQTLHALALTPAGQVSVPVTPQLGESLAGLLIEGRALLSQQKHAEALPFFKRVTQLDPSSSAAWAYLGYTLGELQRYAEALQANERSTSLDPSSASPGTTKVSRSMVSSAMRKGWRRASAH